MFNVYQQTPFGSGHSEDLGLTIYHLQWMLDGQSQTELREFDALVAQFSVFPGLVKFSNKAKQTASNLIKKKKLQAREAQSLRAVILAVLGQ